MANATTIRCSRCDMHLEPEAFAPSHRRNGDWCRPCRSAYMAEYEGPRRLRHKQCEDCSAIYDPWCNHNHPRSARRRCQPCYLAYQRNRQAPKMPKARQRSLPKTVPLRGDPGMSKEWQTLRASVIHEETHCGFCGHVVDKTLSGLDRMGPTLDHIIPLALGGTNTRENLRLAHRSCNSSAGQRLPRQLREQNAILRAALWMSDQFAS